MSEAAAVQAPDRKPFLTPLVTLVRANVPTFAEVSLATGSGLLLVLSFPNFDLWPLAWIALVPLFVAAVPAGKPGPAFILGWLWGAVFFYGSCWWLTHSMIHYGHLRPSIAYLLLTLPVALVALFPALFCFALVRLTTRIGSVALFAAPFVWVSLEWARYMITGMAWNAIGYSQALHPTVIQTARWGGIYAVGFLVVVTNVAVANAILKTRKRALVISALTIVGAVVIVAVSDVPLRTGHSSIVFSKPDLLTVAVQPNVPMEQVDNQLESALLSRHLSLSISALQAWERTGAPDNALGKTYDSDWTRNDSPAARKAIPRVVIWPESPMNFTYTADPQFQKIVADFAIANRTSVLLNSLESAPDGGAYNSAIMVNEQGRKVAQYDKIRLMPFGEYVPLPRWLPGASSVRAIVGEFKPGSSYTLMPLGDLRAGVFICVETAHPLIAGSFTNEGADVLINISNDGYLGPTPVMRQHLANAIFRAVENDREVLRVTNTGISAYIDASGRLVDVTPGFEQTVRVWTLNRKHGGKTFYTRHGDVLAYFCIALSLGLIGASFMKGRINRRPSAVRRG